MSKGDVDPFALDFGAGKKQKQEMAGAGSRGIPCPKKNWGRACPVCEKATRLFATGSPQDEELARKIYVKKQPYCNVEFLHERGKVYLLALPVGAANAFLDGVYESMTWGNVVHPAPKKDDLSSGLPLVLSKTQGKEKKYPAYILSPKMAAPVQERRVSGKEILTQCYKFSNIVQDIEDGKVTNIFNPRSDMTIGQKVEFKILPNPEGYSQSPIFIAYYHYNVSKEEVEGRVKASQEYENQDDLLGGSEEEFPENQPLKSEKDDDFTLDDDINFD